MYLFTCFLLLFVGLLFLEDSRMDTHTHTQTHTETHRYIDTHTQIHRYMDTHTQTHTETHRYMDTHTQIHRYMDTHTRIHKCPHLVCVNEGIIHRAASPGLRRDLNQTSHVLCFLTDKLGVFMSLAAPAPRKLSFNPLCRVSSAVFESL